MKLINNQIYNYAEKLELAFKDETKYFPAKINFLIQKNAQILKQLATEIISIRYNTLNKYMIINEENEKIIPQDKIEIVNNELEDLLNIEQEVDLYTIELNEIEDIEFTSQQMNALLFMIDEECDIEVI